eukprot:scaffold4240_cov163-Amphora_coffeaeformis.AAC.4
MTPVMYGYSRSLSADGSTVAAGGRWNDSSGLNSGHVRVFAYNHFLRRWEQLGDDFDGEAISNEFGHSISLSADGRTVAVGGPGDDAMVKDSGYIRVFASCQVSKEWIQLGLVLVGERVGDAFGSSVSLSADGLTLAVGGRRKDGNGIDSGHVQVFSYTQDTIQWAQLGHDMGGGVLRRFPPMVER